LDFNVSHFRVKRLVVAARGLAGVLTAVFLLFELLAANSGFHQAFHHGGKAASNSCVLCLLAQGHVVLHQSAPVVTASVRSSIDPAPEGESIAPADLAYLASPSRAPPAFGRSLSVVA